MENPWLDYDFEAPTKVHPMDRELFDKVNLRLSRGKKEYILSDKNVALPYFGDPNANFYLLYANPGLGDETSKEETAHLSKIFDMARKHQLSGPEAFVFLRSEFENTPGFKWWEETLRWVFRRFESPHVRDKALKNMFSAEIHPYKSKSYGALTGKEGYFPTAAYTYHLVQQAVDRGALILIARCRKEWEKAVPSLASYEKVIYLSNPQQKRITPNNVISKSRDFDTEQAKNYAWQLITKEALLSDVGSEVRLPF